MTRNVRFLAFLALALVCSLPSFGQDRYSWRTGADVTEGVRGNIVGTVADVDEARNQITIDPDERGPRVTANIDSVSTQFNGFGGVINGQPEIFVGSQGLSNVRVGDRIEVRGVGAANQVVRADYVSLMGRPVAAPQTGVGQTRSPNQVSTPSATNTTTAGRVAPIEGTVQQVDAVDGRIVIVTDRREVMTVRTSNATPVNYRNETYRVANLDIGDRVRVTPDLGSSSPDGEIRAGSIEVTRSVQEGKTTPTTNTIGGRVASSDRTLDIVTIDTGKQSVRVDVATATDQQGRRIRALDFRSGDRVEINGRYSPTTTDLFVANTVRWSDEPAVAPRPSADTGARPAGTIEDVFGTPPAAQELGAVTIYGTVRETLANSPQLVLRDNQGRTVRLHVLEDFVVRARGTGYITADRLKEGDNIVVKAFRDLDGNYIAQTIRFR